jgi:small subunit ribosomal protein S1
MNTELWSMFNEINETYQTEINKQNEKTEDFEEIKCFKSDGLIARTEFRDMPELKAGDVVEVLLETKEDPNGQLILSRKKAVSERAWENILIAHDNDEIVQGYVKTRTKGGLVVDVMGIDTFLPVSQIDT